MNLDRKMFSNTLISAKEIFNRYAVVWFSLLLVAVYGFVLMQINTSRSIEPTDSDITAQTQASATPHIDKTVVSQIESLQDHSVNVSTLFEQARQNPFHE